MELIKDIEIYNILYYFIVYSFLGWIVESIFKSILFKRIINSGFLHGPFIPIYGVGAVIVLIFFKPFSDSILLLFILGFVFMTIMEYIVGVFMEKVFNTSWWDYTGNFMNINGKVCLENSIYWGLLTVFLIKVLHPEVQNIVQQIPYGIGLRCIALFVIYFLIDYTATLVGVLNLQERIKSLVYKMDTNEFKSKEELKEDLTELKTKILKKSKRLLRIYPKLTYLKINKKLRDIVNEIKNRN